MENKIKIIITGATGMVGEGVLMECLKSPRVESVLALNRRTDNIQHPRHREIVHDNFLDIRALELSLSGFDACFFCLGISSIGIDADQYYSTTYDLTMHVADILSKLNPGMTFCYISGAGTDSSEKGRLRWARVKGKTENDLMKLPFRQVFALRPGFIKPIKGQSHVHSYYKYVSWMFPIGRILYPRGFCTVKELTTTMIRLTKEGYSKKVIEGNDIVAIGRNTSTVRPLLH